MRSESTVTVQVARSFFAPAERVFDAWLEPDTARRWLFATPTGEMVRVEIDPHVGGEYTIVERRDGEEVEHVGRYLSIDRPRRLAFTFAVPKFSKASTTVTIDIIPIGTGCELTLTHEGVLAEWASRTEEGWGKLLAGLAATLD